MKEKTIVVKLVKIYFHELGFLCAEIRDNCARVFEATPPRGEPLFDILPWIHSSIGHALTAAANVKKLLDDKRPRDKRHESEDSYELRLVRAAMLRDQLEGIDLKEMLDVQVRNSLEHFDEYLDAENVRLRGQTVPSGALFNVAMTTRDMFSVENEGPVLHIRTYETSTRRFLHLRGEIDIGKIHDEAVAILNRLQERKLIDSRGTRPYFMHHPELLGPLCSAAWETLRDLMAEAVCEKQGFRPGMLAVVQTYDLQLQPGQKHGIRGPKSLNFRNAAILKFFEENL